MKFKKFNTFIKKLELQERVLVKVHYKDQPYYCRLSELDWKLEQEQLKEIAQSTVAIIQLHDGFILMETTFIPEANDAYGLWKAVSITNKKQHIILKVG